jgi:hypothetical protein
MITEYVTLDLRLPLHSQAYTEAAGFYLSFWPQEWSAEKLCLTLLAEEEDEHFPDQKQIRFWEPIEKSCEANGEEVAISTEEFISQLAESMVMLAERHKSGLI